MKLETTPPFPDKMSFKEMYEGLFNRDFLSDEEFKTICDAANITFAITNKKQSNGYYWKYKN